MDHVMKMQIKYHMMKISKHEDRSELQFEQKGRCQPNVILKVLKAHSKFRALERKSIEKLEPDLAIHMVFKWVKTDVRKFLYQSIQFVKPSQIHVLV